MKGKRYRWPSQSLLQLCGVGNIEPNNEIGQRPAVSLPSLVALVGSSWRDLNGKGIGWSSHPTCHPSRPTSKRLADAKRHPIIGGRIGIDSHNKKDISSLTLLCSFGPKSHLLRDDNRSNLNSFRP